MRFKKTIIEDSTKIKFKRKDSTKTKIKFKRNDNKDQRFSKFLPSPRGVFNDVTWNAVGCCWWQGVKPVGPSNKLTPPNSDPTAKKNKIVKINAYNTIFKQDVDLTLDINEAELYKASLIS